MRSDFFIGQWNDLNFRFHIQKCTRISHFLDYHHWQNKTSRPQINCSRKGPLIIFWSRLPAGRGSQSGPAVYGFTVAAALAPPAALQHLAPSVMVLVPVGRGRLRASPSHGSDGRRRHRRWLARPGARGGGAAVVPGGPMAARYSVMGWPGGVWVAARAWATQAGPLPVWGLGKLARPAGWVSWCQHRVADTALAPVAVFTGSHGQLAKWSRELELGWSTGASCWWPGYQCFVPAGAASLIYACRFSSNWPR